MLIRERKFYRKLLILTIPLILQQLLRISVDTVNSVMLGRISQYEMSAVSQANQIFFIYFTLCQGLSAGCAILVAQYWGKQDRSTIPVVIAHALRTVFALGVIATLLIFLFPSFFMRIYSSDPQLIEIGSMYLRQVCIMYAACAVSTMLFGAARGLEQVRLVLFTNLVSYSVNILLDYVLIYGKLGLPAMGVRGVAIGTVIARITELLLAGYLFFSNPDIPFSPSNILDSDPAIRTSFLKISAPIIAHEFLWSFGTSSGAMITGQLGRDAVAGYNVTTVLYDLGATIGHGYLNACAVVIGMILGSGDKEKAKKAASSMLVMGLFLGIVIGTVTWLCRKPFLNLYVLTPEAREYAMQFMTIISIIWPFSLIEMTGMVAILRAGGDGKTGFFTDLVVMWMICIPLAWLAAFKWHAEPWVVVAIIKAIIALEAIVALVRIHQYHWVRNLTEEKA